MGMFYVWEKYEPEGRFSKDSYNISHSICSSRTLPLSFQEVESMSSLNLGWSL